MSVALSQWPTLITERPIPVVLAEPHDAVRLSLRRLLEGEQDLRVVAESGRLASLERRLLDHHPRVLVLDLNPADGVGLHDIRRISRRAPEVRIIAISMHEDPGFARAALDAGAAGFVLKEMADSELPQAIRQAIRGSRFVSPNVAARLQPRASR
jgi:two-component system response regulator NreC